MHCVRESQQQGESGMAWRTALCRQGNEMPHTTSENDIRANFMISFVWNCRGVEQERQTGEKMRLKTDDKNVLEKILLMIYYI